MSQGRFEAEDLGRVAAAAGVRAAAMRRRREGPNRRISLLIRQLQRNSAAISLVEREKQMSKFKNYKFKDWTRLVISLRKLLVEHDVNECDSCFCCQIETFHYQIARFRWVSRPPHCQSQTKRIVSVKILIEKLKT